MTGEHARVCGVKREKRRGHRGEKGIPFYIRRQMKPLLQWNAGRPSDHPPGVASMGKPNVKPVHGRLSLRFFLQQNHGRNHQTSNLNTRRNHTQSGLAGPSTSGCLDSSGRLGRRALTIFHETKAPRAAILNSDGSIDSPNLI